MLSNTAKHAKRELEILIASSTDRENRPVIEPFKDEIVALADKFGKSGQSGGSAPFTANALAQAIKKLCLQEPIAPLTGVEEEWFSHDGFQQNIRESAVFKHEAGAYYLDAIVWKTQTGSTWSGNAICKDGTKIKSRQYIKAFPFTPKTFYIDVIEKEVAKDDWEFYIKDEKQLEAVFKYYDGSTK